MKYYLIILSFLNILCLNVKAQEKIMNLNEVTISPKDTNAASIQQSNIINKVDLQLRPVNSSQDLLRLIPGLFIAQHAGGGKAEQIFLRGFDCDHGTDFASFVDGIPVNMISHAHGQGYADMHFLTPETVSELDVYKGPYFAKFGDLATSGAGDFKTYNYLTKNVLKIEGGQFNTFRGMLMLNLLKDKHLLSKYKENLYFTGEYRYTDAYFSHPQNFSRYNTFIKYYGLLSPNTILTISQSAFGSKWNASGQIPTRAVEDGSIDRFGSIDPSEGGNTFRANSNIILEYRPNDHSSFKNQAYYSRYNFNLYSDFTFFLSDAIHGDELNQKDNRNMSGYKSNYSTRTTFLGKQLNSEIGAGVRYDNASISLDHVEKRVFLNHIAGGKLNQFNPSAYADENLYVTKKLIINPGLRYDIFNFDFRSSVNPDSSGNVTAARLSPKLNFVYNFTDNIQLYFRNGYGFHSNDARAVIINKVANINQNMIPRALGSEVGTTFKPFRNMLVNVSFWALSLENELVYGGDDGTVQSVGRTQREGIDLGIRYELINNLFFDLDLNYNHGRLLDAPKAANHIPLAPIVTSIAGISYKPEKGFGGSLRYRFLSDRPGNESNTLVAKGYFITDLILNYTQNRYQLAVSVENLFNIYWKEAQFDTESRLKNEPNSVDQINYTPGTPRFIKGMVSWYF
jgi:outer membrane receptor for Fe3+-dicitrate